MTDLPATPSHLAQFAEIEVSVEKIVAGGEGLARHEGLPIFVPRSAPGDRLRVRLVQRKPSYARAEIVEILTPGPGRRKPPCPHFDLCGGCDLQHLEDGEQSRLKAAAVVETLRRLGGVDWPGKVELITGEAWGYRLRTQLRVERVATAETEDEAEGEAEVAAKDAPVLPPVPPRVGYFQRGTRELVPVDVCPVLVPELEAMLGELPGALMAVTAERQLPERIDLAAGDEGAVTAAPPIAGLPTGEVTLQVGENRYVYDAGCFFQTHRGLLGRLVEVAVGEHRGEEAFDLYCGVGLFTMALARRYTRVTAVEGDRAAARYARINARRNHLRGVEVEARAVESWLAALPRHAERVLVDPPRTGLTLPVRAALLGKRPRRLTYVSCHPATLARDLKAMGHAFAIESIALLDLFPQTGHMEAVIQLTAVDPKT